VSDEINNACHVSIWKETGTYRSHAADDIPLDESRKDRTRGDEGILLKDREIRVDVISPHVRLVGPRCISREGVVDKPGFRDVVVVEQGRGQTLVVPLVDADEALSGRVGDMTLCDVGNVRVPGKRRLEKKK
jgi:hypothetical protein